MESTRTGAASSERDLPGDQELPSYASGTSDKPLLGVTIGADLDRTVASFPDRDALVECATGRRWTYREFLGDVEALAAGLSDAGPPIRDPVGNLGANRAEGEPS